MGRFPLAAALALLSVPLQAGVEITASDGRIDVTAAQAPLSEVLDGLARKTRMKVVYDGATPRTPVTVQLRRRTLTEAVLGVLEGQGVNYMLALDVSGTQVETLLIVGAGGSPGGFTTPGASLAARTGRRDTQRAKDEEPVAEIEDAVEYEPAGAAVPHDVPKEPEVKPSPAPYGPLNPTFPPGMAPVLPGPPPGAVPPPVASPSPSPSHSPNQ